MKDNDWEILGQRRTIGRLCVFLKRIVGNELGKVIRDRLGRTFYLSKVDHVQKIRDRKQRTDIGKYFFVNRITKNWNQLLAEALGAFPCKPKILRKRVRKATVNGVKCKEWKCAENHLKVQ